MDLQAIFDLAAKFAQDLLLAALPVLITAGLVWLRAELKQQKLYKLIEQYAPMIVRAAEQLKLAELIQDRKAYAVEQLQLVLTQHGVKIDVALVAMAVEAAVLEEFNSSEALKPRVSASIS